MNQIDQARRDAEIMALKSEGKRAIEIATTLDLPTGVVYAAAVRKGDPFRPGGKWDAKYRKRTTDRDAEIMSLKRQGKSPLQIQAQLQVGSGAVYEAARRAGDPFRYEHQMERSRDPQRHAEMDRRIMALKAEKKTSLEIAIALNIPQHRVTQAGRHRGDPFKKSDYPSPVPLSERNAEVMALKAQGHNPHEIAGRLGMHPTSIRNIAVRMGDPFPRTRRKAKRDREIYEARQTGRTYEDIGKEHGIDQARVCRICQHEALLVKQEQEEGVSA